jgi:preprotein translocase subunit SecE
VARIELAFFRVCKAVCPFALGTSHGLIIRPVVMTWIREYLENVIAEMEKVNWPSRDELISSTLVTIVATLIISGFIFLADQVIQRVLRILYQV